MAKIKLVYSKMNIAQALPYNIKGSSILNVIFGAINIVRPMNILQRIIIETTKRKLHKKKGFRPDKKFAHEINDIKVEIKHLIHDSFLILLGIAAANLGLNGFLLPNGFMDGGVTGISLMATELTTGSLGIFLVLINIPFIIMGFSTISRAFAVRSFIAIFLLAVSIHFVPMPTITDDKLLVAVFGPGHWTEHPWGRSDRRHRSPRRIHQPKNSTEHR